MLYLENLIRDLLKFKLYVLMVVLGTTLIGILIGYKTKVEIKPLSESEQLEIENYQSRVAEYEETVRLAEEALASQTAVVDNYHQYIENSILMKIDPSSVKTSTACYVINCEEGANLEYVKQGILSFLGSEVRGNIENGQELEVEYWEEVFDYSIENNVLELNFSHYDAEKGKQILNLICERLEKAVSDIAKTQGSFSLELLTTSQTEHANNKYMDFQSEVYNNLRNHAQWQADAEKYVIGCKDNLDSYRSNNVPEALVRQELKPVEVREVLKRYAILGALFGFVLCGAFFLIRYILSDQIRNAKCLQGTMFNVLGTFKNGNFYPDLGRIMMDVKILQQSTHKKGVFIYDMVSDTLSESVTAALIETMKSEKMYVESGRQVFAKTDELKQMVNMGTSLLTIEAGKTSFKQLEEYQKLCERYQISMIGIIVIE